MKTKQVYISNSIREAYPTNIIKELESIYNELSANEMLSDFAFIRLSYNIVVKIEQIESALLN